MSSNLPNPVHIYGIRYCDPRFIHYATGDQLFFMLEDGWAIARVDNEIWGSGGRRRFVYQFSLMRGYASTSVGVIRTPYIARFVRRLRRLEQPIFEKRTRQSETQAVGGAPSLTAPVLASA